MSKYKIIKFTTKRVGQYSEDLSILMSQGPLTQNSRPYIGARDKETGNLISCIWIDSLSEICMITEKSYRNQGVMSLLLEELVNDIFCGRIKEVTALPTNVISKNILKRAGFLQDDSVWFSFSIS